MTSKQRLGQYFTTHIELKEKVYEFILNNPTNILEPCIGRGDLVKYVLDKAPCTTFDMYEIDTNINMLDEINEADVEMGDFLMKNISKTFKTIIGNPPYIRQKRGRNMYIDFIEKCFNLLEDSGELIFIVPSDFFKLTSSSKLLNIMLKIGTFTHIFHPHNEQMFENACIDVIVFRYCKNKDIDKIVLYNDTPLYIANSNGLITFEKDKHTNSVLIKDYFHIYVGLVSGKEDVYKNAEIGNIEVLNGDGKKEKYIFIEKFPCDDDRINNHLLHHKTELVERKIRKFNDKNWFEWGAPRNVSIMKNNIGTECIYMSNLTRKPTVSFVGTCTYFGGGLIMLSPKRECNLKTIVSYLNSKQFKNNYIFSGRFKIGHRQISNSCIPCEYL